MQNASSVAERPTTSDQGLQTLNIVKERTIAAPADIVWDAILEEIGPGMATVDGATLNMKLEPWPGGRYFRDLGQGVGHLWGHVQVFKPSRALEIVGPMFMSYPVASHVEYRLVEENGRVTRLTLTHRAFGMIDPEHVKGAQKGWGQIVDKIADRAARRRS